MASTSSLTFSFCSLPDIGHIPSLDSRESLLNLVVFACGIELQNAICPQSYEPVETDSLLRCALLLEGVSPDDALKRFDISEKSYEMRLQNICSRGRIIQVLRVVFKRFSILDAAGTPQDGWSFVFIPTLAWMIHALKHYYNASLKSVPESDRSILSLPSRDLFSAQLEWTADRWLELRDAVDKLERDQIPVDNLMAPLSPFTIHPIPNPRMCALLTTTF